MQLYYTTLLETGSADVDLIEQHLYTPLGRSVLPALAMFAMRPL